MTTPAVMPQRASSRTRIAMIAAIVMLIIGAIVAIFGVNAASDASSDLEANEAAIEDAKDDAASAQEQLDNAEQDREIATGRLDNATDAASSTTTEARAALPIALEVVQSDQQIIDLFTSKSAAADAEDAAGFNTLVDDFNAAVATRNDAFNRLSDTLPGR